MHTILANYIAIALTSLSVGVLATVGYYESSVALLLGRKLFKTVKGDTVAALIHISKFTPFSFASSVAPPIAPAQPTVKP